MIRWGREEKVRLSLLLDLCLVLLLTGDLHETDGVGRKIGDLLVLRKKKDINSVVRILLKGINEAGLLDFEEDFSIDLAPLALVLQCFVVSIMTPVESNVLQMS